MIRTGDDLLYTGITTDVERRLGEHEDGKGAKCLRGRGPLELVFQLAVGDRSLALRIEHSLKGRTRREKEEIVAEAPSLELLTTRLLG